MTWIEESLRSRGGTASITEIAQDIWAAHETDLRASGPLFYNWQYDMRWAGQKLQVLGRLTKNAGKRGDWSLKK
jgi:hypothetical protein